MNLNEFITGSRTGGEIRNRSWFRKCVFGVVASVLATALAQAQGPPADWPMFGQNASNTASNPTAQDITIKHADKLKVKWTVATTGDVSARGVVANGIVYFPDWGPVIHIPGVADGAVTGTSTLWAVNASNGNVIWSHPLSDYGLAVGTHSRTTPAVVEGLLYLGTQQGAYLLAINAASGALVWKTQLESTDPAAAITMSPVVVNGVVYTGVTSLVEGGTLLGYDLTQPVSGSVVAVNAGTGLIQWKTRTVPPGYSGAGVWGSNPVVDTRRNTIFVGTGNNYRHPDDSAVSSTPGVTYGQCILGGGTAASCNSPEDHVDSILALNLNTGALKWATKLVTWGQQPFVTDGSDDWNVDCAVSPALRQCPTNPGPDYDFGSAPNEITYQSPTGPKTIIGAGQKSGIYYALDPDTGAELWHTQVGPGSSLGGMEWGSASDGNRIYVQITNLYGIPSPAGGSAGSWAALDPATGAILWQKADPNGAVDLGPMAVANGVVYASSMSSSPGAPTMLALDAATGQTLWSFAAGSSVNAGATIVKDTVYWGSGYAHLGIPGYTGNTRFYAFTVNGQ